ncbi:TIGR01777 family oxidoreductase [Chryseobacterium camelliae]|uniref:TIGR01777 family oxidoreductase n=1 Tax=Chryseobacterium camelliae TaxID=1265445 RepID=UPI000C1C90FC|nr:TIGR01777 family oxidoreductase [Chryseobacterium camelliae]
MKEIILITGANGLIARKLAEKLDKEYRVRFLTRKKKKAHEFEWDLKKGTVDQAAFDNVSHIIHLAGANISEKRWTDERKKELISSRVDSARLLMEGVRNRNIKLKSFISASGINYYGTETTEKIYTEEDPAGKDFLSEVVVLWEQVADEFTENGLAERVVKLRTAVVLSEKEGALKKLMVPVEYGIGSPLGTGKQYMPWIHLEDIASMYEYAVKNNSVEGAYNAVAPQHTTNAAFTKEVAGILNRPFIMPNVPAFLLKLIFGELSVAVLEGSRASAKKIMDSGFDFRFPDLHTALQDLLKDKINK